MCSFGEIIRLSAVYQAEAPYTRLQYFDGDTLRSSTLLASVCFRIARLTMLNRAWFFRCRYPVCTTSAVRQSAGTVWLAHWVRRAMHL